MESRPLRSLKKARWLRKNIQPQCLMINFDGNDEELVDLLAQEALLRCFNTYGVEGTEDKIKELCKNHPALLECHLRNYKKLINARNH